MKIADGVDSLQIWPRRKTSWFRWDRVSLCFGAIGASRRRRRESNLHASGRTGRARHYLRELPHGAAALRGICRESPGCTISSLSSKMNRKRPLSNVVICSFSC